MSGRGSITIADLQNEVDSLSRQNAKLERMLAKIGTQADNAEFRELLNKEQKQTNSSLKTIVIHFKNNQHRFNRDTVNRLTTQFDQSYKHYQRLTKDIDYKVTTLLSAASKSVIPDSALQQEITREYGSQSPPDSSGPYQTLDLSQIQFIEYSAQEIEYRHKQIKALEREILEVAEMYRDLLGIVNEQQASIDIVENNIVTTQVKAQQAHTELVQAEAYQTSARKKKLCIVIIILIVILIIGLAAGLANK